MTILRENAHFHQAQIHELRPGASVLTSWKDIANYFGKGVRTVQRWEKELGLPIRRPKHSTKSTVLAVLDEINDWVKCQQFSEERDSSTDPERSELLQQIEVLQAEVFELRRQLQLTCAKSA
jgi:transcriptional regulator with XRE-family HTH domain